jgi:hypothetical protein
VVAAAAPTAQRAPPGVAVTAAPAGVAPGVGGAAPAHAVGVTSGHASPPQAASSSSSSSSAAAAAAAFSKAQAAAAAATAAVGWGGTAGGGAPLQHGAVIGARPAAVRAPPGHDDPQHRRPPQYFACRHFTRQGRCATGTACKFAHGEQELRYWNDHYAVPVQQAATSWKISAAPPRPPPVTGERAAKVPTTFALCRHFSNLGRCAPPARLAQGGRLTEEARWGERMHPVTRFEGRWADWRGAVVGGCWLLGWGGCRWLGGSCRLGERCRFAHGGEELNSWNAATGKRMLTEEELSKQVNQALSTEH